MKMMSTLTRLLPQRTLGVTGHPVSSLFHPSVRCNLEHFYHFCFNLYIFKGVIGAVCPEPCFDVESTGGHVPSALVESGIGGRNPHAFLYLT